jgi:NAD(P)-dependent dehydrogenase (short-subunit alcohol dehydrogenase family)
MSETPQRKERLLITGASSGIGEAIAQRIGRSTPLILHGRDLERLKQLQARLPQPEEHIVWVQDLSQAAGIAPGLTELLANTGDGVGYFIHCAGQFRPAPIAVADPATVAREFQVNFFSAAAIIPILLDRSINPTLVRAIVLLSSIATQLGAKGYSLYAATKGALDGLAKSLAPQIAPTRINTILSGAIRTPGTAFLYDGLGEAEINRGYPLGPGRADDVACLAEHLISDEARWIDGQNFILDGGRMAAT